MMRCAKCRRKCRTLSYAGGLCNKCDRKAVRAANEEFARAAVQEQHHLEHRRRELTALRWPARVVRGVVWGCYDGLRSFFRLFAGLWLYIASDRGEHAEVGEPTWPGGLWFLVWAAFTLAAALTTFFVWGWLAALIALLATAPALGAIRGGYLAARNDWNWWLR